jgi:hypothetical protein
VIYFSWLEEVWQRMDLTQYLEFGTAFQSLAVLDHRHRSQQHPVELMSDAVCNYILMAQYIRTTIFGHAGLRCTM